MRCPKCGYDNQEGALYCGLCKENFNKKKRSLFAERTGLSGSKEADPSRFNDPLAEKTSWTPLVKGGFSWRTRRLVRPHSGRVEFSATDLSVFLYMLLIALGGAMIAGGAGKMLLSLRYLERTPGHMLILMGVMFLGVGILICRLVTKKVVFDKSYGYFWKGGTSPHSRSMQAMRKDVAHLDAIHALQIVSELIRGHRGGSFYSYELNLVLKDGSRMNVVDHGRLNSLREDAKTLSEFLSVPVWDVS